MNSTPTLLGQTVTYPSQYSPALLEPIKRASARAELTGLNASVLNLPFVGWDLWRAYEVSWLNSKGLPQVAIVQIQIPFDSPSLVESKSLKLYLNSLNLTVFKAPEDVLACLHQDLSQVVGSEIHIDLKTAEHFDSEHILEPNNSLCLDTQDIEVDCYTPNPDFLNTDASKKVITESVFSRLLKSNCPVTGQPDWASVHIDYKGTPIDHAGLLRYIVSLRNHEGFHEHCVEQLFCEIWHRCKPQTLSVYARYTRRGGIDINPWRATPSHQPPAYLPARSAQQ